MAQLMPLPLTISCFSKIQIGFTFLVPAYPGSPGKRVVKRVCVLKSYLIEVGPVTAELINEEEQKVLTELSRINRTERIDSAQFGEKGLGRLTDDVKGDRQTATHQEVCPNVFYVPLLWAVDLVNQAYDEQRINDYGTRRIIIEVKSKGSPYSIAERRVPGLIPVLCSQPAGDVSHKPGGRLPLLSARPAVTPATLKKAVTNFDAWRTEAQWV